MKRFHPETANRPFWKVGNSYETLNDLVQNPDIKIDFPDGPDETLKEVVLHRLNSQPDDIEHQFGFGHRICRYGHKDLIRQVEQETDDGRYFMRAELMTLRMQYNELRE